jgi:hypothetical protein
MTSMAVEEVEIGEVGVDKVSEEAHEHAHHGGAHARAPWTKWLALATAFFAVLAAIAALLSGKYANEAQMHLTEANLRQTQASDQWSFFQAKSTKQALRESEATLLAGMKAPDEDVKKAKDAVEKYEREKAGIEKQAKTLESDRDELRGVSDHELHTHHAFAYVVTTLQVTIGLAAIAALMERRSVFYVALAAGALGVVLFVMALLTIGGGHASHASGGEHGAPSASAHHEG